MREFEQHLFITILNMSITSSYIIMLVLLARLPLKRVSSAISYGLWAVVLFRLLCPVSFTLPVSLLSLLKNGSAGQDYVPQDIGFMEQPQISTGVPPVDSAVNAFLPAATPQTSMNPMQGILAIAAVLWLAGVLLLLFSSLFSYIRFRRGLRTALLIRDNIYESEKISSPFVMGLWSAKIYLPVLIEEEKRRYVLLHEQTHIRRFDHWAKAAAYLALCIHWFNPLVWLAFSLMTRDMEMSCDEKVLKGLGSGIKKDYSASLLSLAIKRQPSFRWSPLFFGESSVKARISHILNYKKPAFWVAAGGIIALAVTAVLLLANPGADSPKNLKNYVIAENSVSLKNGEPVTVKLVMTKGRYYDIDYAGAGGGVTQDNYEGSYTLYVYDADGRELSSLLIDTDGWGIGEGHLLFGGKFDLLFDDYNDDGNPDFSIGQWGSSNINLFTLFSVDESGMVKAISAPALIATSEGKYEQDYSYAFSHANGVIQTQRYNNTVGDMESASYEWDEKSGMFTKNSEETSKPSFYIMTADNAPIGCEYGISGEKDALSLSDMLSRLDDLQGFLFSEESASGKFVEFQFDKEDPQSISLRYILPNADQPVEYAIDSADFQFKVPERAGIYSFLAEILWKSGKKETAFFRITVTK